MDFAKIIESLRNRGYKAVYFETSTQCREYLNIAIDGKTVGIGGSVTVSELELYPALYRHNTVYWHGDSELVEKLGNLEIRNRASDAKIYISSVNAMTEDGVIINIDCVGNRIGSMCYGHKKVYLILGKNKIAPDFESALWRARNIASPKNAKRLGRKTPCAVLGDKCYNCSSPDRICNGFLVMDRAMAGCETEVIIIGEELGY